LIGRLGRILAVALLVAITLGCGSSRLVGSASPGQRVLHLEDSGQTITLQTGERLTLELGSPAYAHWMILRFPEDLLSGPVAGPGGVSFTALARGQGQIEAVNTYACPSIHGCSIPESNVHASETGDMTRPRSFEVTLQVV
jgi:hypothetical protein